MQRLTDNYLFSIDEKFEAKEIEAEIFLKKLPLEKEYYKIGDGRNLYYIRNTESFKIPERVFINKEAILFNSMGYDISVRCRKLQIDYENERLFVDGSFDASGHSERFTEGKYSLVLNLSNFEIAGQLYTVGKSPRIINCQSSIFLQVYLIEAKF